MTLISQHPNLVNLIEMRKRGLTRNWKIIPSGFELARQGYQLVREPDGAALIVSVGPEPDGRMWRHASLSFPGRLPEYEEMKWMRDICFGDGFAYQVFAPPSAHVDGSQYGNASRARFCLHLWGRDDGLPAMPDFAASRGGLI